MRLDIEFREIPELAGNGQAMSQQPLRLPETGNLPTTPRLRNLVDTVPVQRLRGIKQLGLAYLVYPGAVHTRFEHSLGTYDLARRLVLRLVEGEAGDSGDGGVEATSRGRLTPEDVRTFLVAALLHDVGHYPFSHTLEELPPDDRGTVRLPKHDERARELILGDDHLRRVMENEWEVRPERVVGIIDEGNPPEDPADRRLVEMLSGPLNPDRLDYLRRDSAHVGVPYGKVIDLERLFHTVGFTPDGAALGIGPKGVSAVETVIFASYLMYREVYWHHTVRAAGAMLKRATSEALRRREIRQEELVSLYDEEAVHLLRQAGNSATRDLMERLTGGERRLYKRVFTANLGALPPGEFFARIAEGGYWEWEELAREACRGLSRHLGREVPEHSLIIDVAGQRKGLFFAVPVLGERPGSTGDPEISLVAPYLSQNFDRQAKQVQLIAPPELAGEFRRYLGLAG